MTTIPAKNASDTPKRSARLASPSKLNPPATAFVAQTLGGNFEPI